MLIEKKHFLPKEEFDSTFGQLRDNTNFPWYYSKNTAYTASEDDQSLWDFSFSNVLYIDGIPSNFAGQESAKLLEKICQSENFKLKEILRIRAGLITKTPIQNIHMAHVDFTTPHYTALFYLTTCDAPTIIYNQVYPNDIILTEMARVTSEENKVVIFDGLRYHASTTQTDKKQRIVINFNFTIEENANS